MFNPYFSHIFDGTIYIYYFSSGHNCKRDGDVSVASIAHSDAFAKSSRSLSDEPDTRYIHSPNCIIKLRWVCASARGETARLGSIGSEYAMPVDCYGPRKRRLNKISVCYGIAGW